MHYTSAVNLLSELPPLPTIHAVSNVASSSTIPAQSANSTNEVLAPAWFAEVQPSTSASSTSGIRELSSSIDIRGQPACSIATVPRPPAFDTVTADEPILLSISQDRFYN